MRRRKNKTFFLISIFVVGSALTAQTIDVVRPKPTPKQETMTMKEQLYQSTKKTIIGNFTPSLQQKEKMDFLLTPALLVQEAISENIIMTYPME